MVYLKVCGDYNRYMAEVCGDQAAGDSAAECYKEALKVLRTS